MELKFDEKIINVVFKYLDTGMEKFASSVIVMMSIFAIFDLWISLTSELTDFGRALKTLGRKVIGYGFWFAVVKNYSAITDAIFISFTNIGRLFGGEPGTHGAVTEFLSVDKIAGEGFDTLGKILELALDFNTFFDIKFFLFYIIIFVVCFFFLIFAIGNLVIAIIQFKFIAGLGLIILVLINLEFTRDIGMRVIHGIIHAALNLAVITALLNITFFLILKEIPIPSVTKQNNALMDMLVWSFLFITLTYMSANSDKITNLIMHGHGGFSGTGLGQAVASSIAQATTVAVVTVGTLLTAGTAAVGGAAATKTGAASGGSKISEIFKGAVKGGADGFRKSKKARDTISNVGNIASEATTKATGNQGTSGKIRKNASDIFNRFKKKKKDEEDEV